MTIETKFNIGDDAWFMQYNKPTHRTVEKIEIVTTAKCTSIVFFEYKYVRENRSWEFLEFATDKTAFSTKEELLNHLFNNI
jgi:hypothetical protein